MNITFYGRTTREDLGLIPYFLNENAGGSAVEQLNRNYAHGGGFDPFPGFTLGANNSLTYPGDPPMQPLAKIDFGAEQVFVYDYGWVAVVQPNRSFQVSRMD